MAGDSEITAAVAVTNSGVLIPAGISVTSTGAGYLDVSTMDGSKVVFVVTSTAAAEIDVQDGAEFTGGTVGNLVFATTGAKTYAVGPLETSRFKDSNGYIKIEKSTGDTTPVSVQAILLP